MRFWILMTALLVACGTSGASEYKGVPYDLDAGPDSDTDSDGDGDTDSDADTDGDTDTDVDTDTDTDTGTESDSETGSETDTPTDTDTGTGTGLDTDTETETDTDAEIDGGVDGGDASVPLLPCPEFWGLDMDVEVQCEGDAIFGGDCGTNGKVDLPGYDCGEPFLYCCIGLAVEEDPIPPDAGPVDWCSQHLDMWCVEWPSGLTCEDLGGTSQPGFDSTCPSGQTCCEFPHSYVF